MKSVRVPAQITSIEDTIYGDITLKQFMVLVSMVVLFFVFWIIIPPFYRLTAFKVVLSVTMVFGGLFLIYRPGRLASQKLSRWFLGEREAAFENKMIFEWLLLLMQYYAVRPRVYLHTKSPQAPKKLITPPKVPQERNTLLAEVKAEGEVNVVLDPREFPLLMSVAFSNTRAKLKLDKKYKIDTLGEEGRTKYIYVEKVAGSRPSKGAN